MEANDSDPDTFFLQIFGTSKNALRDEGVDPDEYARLHVRDAFKDPIKRKLMASPSRLLHLEYFNFATRAYYCMFIALGCLLLTAIPLSESKDIGVGLACVIMIPLAYFMSKSIAVHRRYKHQCTIEGKSSSIRRNPR